MERPRTRPIRSLLFVPGSDEKLLSQIPQQAADAVVIDMEEPQTPMTEAVRVRTRELVSEFFADADRHPADHPLYFARGSVLLYPILETAQAIRLAYEIAMASPRVGYMGGAVSRFGDIHQALGFRWTREGRETLFLRSKVLADAKAAGSEEAILHGDENQGEGHVIHLAHLGSSRLNLEWAADLGVA